MEELGASVRPMVSITSTSEEAKSPDILKENPQIDSFHYINFRRS